MRHFIVCLLALAAGCVALDNGVGLTPAMGYNTWDDFRCGGINASNVEKVADAMIAHGLQKVGYNYVNIDDCWAVRRDNKTGVIIPDPKAFPDGMKALADYVHNKGFKFGIYTDRGTATCVGRPGSQGYEFLDAKTYAAWGVDFVKEDSCSAPPGNAAALSQYGKMRDALNATGRPILFALCGWSSFYAPYGQELGNSWRVGYDVNTWGGMYGNAISVNAKLAQYAGPGGFNDVDALIGSSPGAAVHVSQTQSRTQFSMWAVMAAPLIIGSNVLHITPFDLETYSNKEVIAVDQDKLGLQGELVWEACAPHAAAAAGAAASSGVGTMLGLPPSSKQGFFPLPDGGGGAGVNTTPGQHTPPVPPCQHIWLKKLEDGYALAFVNYTFVNYTAAESSNSPRVGGVVLTADGSGSGSGGDLAMVACNASDPAQLWNITTTDGSPTKVQISDDTTGALDKPACWEVDACNFKPGSSVDTKYGCRDVPKPGNNVSCNANMAWHWNAKNGSMSSVWSPDLCFELVGSGTLAQCSGAPEQRWVLKGAAGSQQIVSATNTLSCVSNGDPPEPVGKLEFDIANYIGWKNAKVRDLWAHKDLGVMSTVSVSLAAGNGTSMLFKLTKA